MSKSESSTLSPESRIDDESDLARAIRLFQADYERADLACKTVQHFRDQAGIPAINEMRYAGYHLSLAYNVHGAISNLSQVTKARAHAQRAIYEAAEAGILQALREIETFKKDYSLVPITDVVKDWLDILVYCKLAQSRLGVQRATGDDRNPDHDKHFEVFGKLSEFTDKLEAARPELNKKIANERRLSRRFITTIILALTGMVISTSVAFIIYILKN